MANQITPQALLTIQLHDWNVLLAQLQQNPETSAADIAYCQAQIERFNQEINMLNQPPHDEVRS